MPNPEDIGGVPKELKLSPDEIREGIVCLTKEQFEALSGLYVAAGLFNDPGSQITKARSAVTQAFSREGQISAWGRIRARMRYQKRSGGNGP